MNKKQAMSALVILALLVGWALFSGEDQAVVAAKQQRDELLQKADTMSDEERRAGFESLREQTRDFTEAQRREFGNGMRQFMMQRVNKLLAMPKAEQNAELDKWINRMEDMRKSGAGRGGPGGAGRGGANGGDRPRGGGANRGKARLDRSTPEMRAKMDAMKDLMNARRKERGLEPIGGGRRFGGGPR